MQSPVKYLVQAIFLAALALVILACGCGGSSLDAWRVWCGLKIAVSDHGGALLWAAAFALQLAAMKWTGAVCNAIFSLLSFALMAWLVLLAAGQEAAVTPTAYEQMTAAGLGEIAAMYPALHWLLPALWLAACLCAQEQMRTFCTAIACYGLWQALTAACVAGLRYWEGMDAPPCADILRNVACCPWLAALLPGCFLLVFALLMAVSEAIFPHSRGKKEESAEQAADLQMKHE